MGMWSLCRYISGRIHELTNNKLVYDQLMNVCCENGKVVRYPNDKEIIEAIKFAAKIK